MKSTPRILQLVHSLNVGGAEMLAATFARRLGGADRVVVACLDELGPLAESLSTDGFTIVSLQRKPGPLDRGCLRRLRELIRHQNIELIHAHQYTPFQLASLARGWSRTPRILFTEHGRFFPDRKNWKWSWINPRLLAPRDRIVAVGQGVKQALIDHEGFSADRIDVVYNGVDVDRREFDPSVSSEVCSSVRGELGISADAFVAFMAARLDSIKDIPTAISAWEQFQANHSDSWLCLAGDGPERARLEAMIFDRRLRNVRLLGTVKDTARLFVAADVVLLTSLSEGIPLSLIEAMSASRPVIATNVGGVPEVVLHEKTGLLHQVGDAPGIAQSLTTLANSPDLRQHLGAAGRKRAVELFSVPRMLADYESIYHTMVR